MPKEPVVAKDASGEVIPAGSVQIDAVDLLSKFGFSDGGVLDDMLFDAGFDPTAVLGKESDGWEVMLGSEVLAHVVRAEFAAALPEGAIRGRQSLSHNPVRLAPMFERIVTEDHLLMLNAWVTPDEVAATAREVTDRFASDPASDPAPVTVVAGRHIRP